VIRRIALACLILPIALLAPACGHDSPAPRPQAETGAALNGDFSGTGPGTLLDARTLPTIDRRLRAGTSIAGRVEYTSTSAITNSETQVTGTVFAPKGTAPEGGWPIVALGHPTSGIETDCAPSLSPSLLGLMPIVTPMVQAGYVVTVPDYQGLGSDQNYHPYLEPTTEGYNLIDAVRAARKLVPETSDRWVAVGISQGAQAAWAANELAATYGAGLNLLGSVSLAPPINVTFLADLAESGELTKEQESPYLALLAALKNEHPEFNLDDYRRGIVEQNWDLLLQCSARSGAARDAVVAQITEDDLRPNSQAATDTLRGYLQKMSLPQKVAAAPMLVIYGDTDALVPVESTDRALAEACGMGDVIDIQRQPGKGHDDLDMSPALPWIGDRFNRGPVTNSCAPPAPPPPPASPEVSQEGA
jgi:pimeloyl-ACP methyl ester carboxylesterase